jgi:uncharacterized protein YfiM (DUF2279 family)
MVNMKRIVDFLVLYQDKVLHFTISSLLIFIFYSIHIHLNYSESDAVWKAFVFTLVVGVVKEIYDYNIGNGDWYDILWNVIGIVFGILLLKSII